MEMSRERQACLITTNEGAEAEVDAPLRDGTIMLKVATDMGRRKG